MASHKALTGKHQYVEFKDETIHGRVKKMVDYRESLDVSKLHVKFSYGNRKTGNLVPSVSLIPIADCGNCKLCSKGCYDIRNVCCYDASRKQKANNSAIYRADPERYFEEIKEEVRFRSFFRWHVSGDIKNRAYLEKMVEIAKATPTCTFLVFTKMFEIVNKWIDENGEFPSNLHVLLSGWRGDHNVNRHNLPVSSPVWKDGSKSCMCTEDATYCGGDCTACAKCNGGCWSAGKGATILFEAH